MENFSQPILTKLSSFSNFARLWSDYLGHCWRKDSSKVGAGDIIHQVLTIGIYSKNWERTCEQNITGTKSPLRDYQETPGIPLLVPVPCRLLRQGKPH